VAIPITCVATIFLFFLVVVLTLLSEVRIFLDRILSLELVEIFLDHIGDRNSLASFNV